MPGIVIILVQPSRYTAGYFRRSTSALSLALPPQLLLLFLPQLLVNLGALGRLVAVCSCGQSSILLAQNGLLALFLGLILALGFAGELVGDGTLVLCRTISIDA